MPQTLKLEYASLWQALVLIFLLITACKKEKQTKEVTLFNQYCTSCHLAPKIDDLPKAVWKNGVLPKMAELMQIEEMYRDPNAIDSAFRPKIKLMDWVLLSEYIVANAPERLKTIPYQPNSQQTQFEESPFSLNATEGSLATFLDFDESMNAILIGNTSGELASFNPDTSGSSTIYECNSPITWYSREDKVDAISEVGILDPSEIARGKFSLVRGSDTIFKVQELHRPVFHKVVDLNKDGRLEVLISEFGNSTGRFSLFRQVDSSQYQKRILFNLPGVVKAEVKDFDKDGKLDIMVMSTQAYEGLTIFYQRADLKFEAIKVLEFSPVYGSSWFELIDFNNDGYDDIITVNGDNADYSYVHKPYHGLRIHLNNGRNQFKQKYFFSINGATRFVADDFDKDGDIDFGVVSTFPDYENKPERSFVYLRNLNSEDFEFQAEVLQNPNLGRWFLMDKGDFDSDGDMDIVLSSFTYSFTPVPQYFKEKWDSTETDLLILRNKLY